jgi:ElaB/YqjD/DUF883 family membrane-anchored ribosome-binding protein
MTNVEGSTLPASANAYGSSGDAYAVNSSRDDLDAEGAAALRESKAIVDDVSADAGEKGRQALNYAAEIGQEAIDNVRDVRDTFGTAIEKSVTARPYTTLALAVAAGFLLGATWRR